MSYVGRILEAGEKILYTTTYSRSLYAPAALAAVFAIAAAALAYMRSEWTTAGVFVATVLGLIAVFLWLRVSIRRWTTEIAVTDRRVIFKRGLIQRHTVEMNLAKVESVDVDQTLVGRLFDYGDVSVRGTGATFETLHNIDAPLKLRSTITAG